MKPPTCKLFIDTKPGEVPYVGLYLVTIGKDGQPNSVYMVTAWRHVKRRDPSAQPRFTLTCERGHTPDDALAADDCWTFHWYPRKKGIAS